jgi:hypothetical protein
LKAFFERHSVFITIISVLVVYGIFLFMLDAVSRRNFAPDHKLKQDQPINQASCPVDYEAGIFKNSAGESIVQCVPTNKARLEAIGKLGPVGDSFGIINSLFGTLTLAFLAATMFLQKKELSDQQKRFEAERIDSEKTRLQLQAQHETLVAASIQQVHDRRIFDWIDLHHRMIERVHLAIGEKKIYGESKGAQAVNRLFNAILFEAAFRVYDGSDPTANQLAQLDPTMSFPPASQALGESAKSHKSNFRSEIQKCFNVHRSRHDSELGHIFRNAYRLLKWVDCEPRISATAKWEYVSIFRAQLSFGELSLMLLNCATEDSGEAAPLFSRYAMFENLPKNDPLVVGYSGDQRFPPCAFEGSLAKELLGIGSVVTLTSRIDA